MDVMGRFTSNVTGQVRPSLERKKNFKNFLENHGGRVTVKRKQNYKTF
jgi:hypothetical protein